MNEQTINKIQSSLGYEFSDRSILAHALSHSSGVSDKLASNERLEFLGDAILDLIICQELFEKFPDYLEGDLTKIKSMMVSRKTCSKIAEQLDFIDDIKIGSGMTASSSLKGSIAAGALEAIIAAIYLDGGLKAAKKFVLRIFKPIIEKVDAQHHHENYKSLLQHHVQQKMKAKVHYELLDEKGPDHHKCFEVAAAVSDKRFPSAWGNNKKEAQQQAAYNALVELGVLKKLKA